MTLADTIANYAGSATREVSGIDEDAFRALYDRTARPLWVYLVRASGSRDLADDLLQETYCRFLSRYGGRSALPPMDEAATRSYLFRIATYLLHDRWRQGGNAVEVDIEAVEAAEVSTAEPASVAHIDVRRVMDSLKPRQRQILWLAYVEGMNHAEIAAITGLGALSIRLLLFRARRQAATLLRPEENHKG